MSPRKNAVPEPLPELAAPRYGAHLGHWTLVALGVLAFLRGEWSFTHDQASQGLEASALGVLLVLAGLVLPFVPWHRLKDLIVELKEILPKRRDKSEMASAAVAEVDAPPVPKEPWRPFAVDRLSLSRHWLLAPAALMLGLANLSILRGQLIAPVLDLSLTFMLGWVYLSNFGKPLVLPHINDNLKTLLRLLLPILFLEAPGVWIINRYVWVLSGYFVVALGGAWMLAILIRWPINLVDDDLGTSRDERWYPAKPFFSSNQLATKIGLVSVAALCGFLSAVVLGGHSPVVETILGFLAIILLLLSFPWLPDGLATWENLSPRLRGGLSLGMAAFAFLLAAHAQDMIENGNYNAALWCFLASGILLVLGLGHYGHRSESGSGEEHSAWSKRLEIVAVLVLLFASLQFRAYHLNIFPYGAEGDEAGSGVWAEDILHGRVDNPIVSANVPLHFFSVTSLMFKLFGVHVWTLRFHAAFWGLISIAATYFFLRFFFGAAVSFLVTTLMSFSYWHLHFSRFGHFNIEQVALEMVAFYFVFRSMKSGKSWSWILGGLAFGLAMQPHLASRLLPFEGIALLLYFFLARRDLLRRHAGGFLIFVIAAWIAVAPALTYWLTRPVSMGRAKSVSIFDRTNSNAPSDVLEGFVKNCKISVMMFNDFSDSRTRDNPLAPQKILEHWTAILYAMAFLYMLYHWRDSMAFLLLAAFFINLCASIFSVEAPQTLRTAGNIPIVFSFMGFMLYDVRESFRLLGRELGKALFLLLMVPLVAFFCYKSYQKLFDEAGQLTFDAVPTYVAEVAGEQGTKDDQAVFFASGFAASHPPVQLFAQDTPIRNFFNVADYLPITLAADKTHLLFFCDVFEPLTPWVQTLYPQSKVVSLPYLTAPGSNLTSYMIVSKEEIASHQGLTAEVDGVKQVAHSDLQYPSAAIPSAHQIRWSGDIRIENYGFYNFSVTGDGDCSISVAGQTAYRRMGGIVQTPILCLPMGLLPIEVSYSPRSNKPLEIDLTGRPHPAGLLYSLRAPVSYHVQRRILLDFPIHGFFGQYFCSSTFSGDAVMEYVEPTVLAHWLDSPLPGNWSADWKAHLKCPKSGPYRFNMQNNGAFGEIFVDGKLVFEGGQNPKPSMHPDQFNPTPYLSAGEHQIEVRFFTPGPSWYEIDWAQPGEQLHLLQPEFVTPIYPVMKVPAKK